MGAVKGVAKKWGLPTPKKPLGNWRKHFDPFGVVGLNKKQNNEKQARQGALSAQQQQAETTTKVLLGG